MYYRIMESHKKGDLTEARVIAELKEREIPVSVPFGDNERYDLVLENPGRRFLRAQVKTGWKDGGTINFRGYSLHTNSNGNVYKKYENDVDCFLVYSHHLEGLFLVWEDEFDLNMSLRYQEPDQDDPTINWAEDYEFDERWPPVRDPIGARSVSLSPAASELSEEFDRNGIPYARKNDSRTAFVAVDVGGIRHTIRAVSSSVNGGRLRFDGIPTEGTFDAHGVYSSETEQVYLVPDSSFDRSISLRVEEPEQADDSIRWASDFTFDEQWPPR